MKIKTTFSVMIRILIWIFLLVGGTVYSIKNDILYHKDIFFNPYFHVISFIFGVLVLKLSFSAASVGGKELKKHGQKGEVVRLETNTLVTTGIYQCSRHPMLFGLTLMPLGVALIFGSFTFITFTAPLEMLFIIFMVLVFEELECKKKFGKEYEIYSKKTPVFPKTKECFKKLFFR